MAVRFILGRSGTGKTRYCTQAIAAELLSTAPGPLILLVPEQASYQAERAILSDERIKGYNRLNVLSFDRLQFLLAGKNLVRPAISSIGRQMIIHRILRESRDKLVLLRSSADRPAMSKQVAETIAELHQYAQTPEDINELLKELNGKNTAAAGKFTDINLVFTKYLHAIEGRFTDADMQAKPWRGAVAKAEFIKGAKLWVDGFAGFTASELAVLAELVKVAQETRIALCLDTDNIDLRNPEAGDIDPTSLFYPTQRTYAELTGIIKKCRVKIAEPVILKKAVRFSASPELAHIEREIFKPQPRKIKATGNIRIVSLPDSRTEAEFVAKEVLKLVKDKAYRYRDIAVIASDIKSCQHYIRAYFEEFGIPFFIDMRKPLNQHPAVELICSSLRTVSGGFAAGGIFAYLKTDLVPLQNGDVDLLENYCTAFGVSGSDWQKDEDWQFDDSRQPHFDQGRVNRIRRSIVEPLFILKEQIYRCGEKINSAEFVRAVFEFLERLKTKETIGKWIEQAVSSADYKTVDEHQQFYDKLIAVFDEMAEVFAGAEMRCEDYLSILSSAFSQLTLAFIPPRLDQVLVGSIERSRHPDLKAVFLTGTTQRQFPSPISSRGILSDQDRQAADAAEFQLAATTEQSLAERQYLAYIAFTRACEKLIVTYPVGDDKGRPAVRSQFVTNLQELFANLSEESFSAKQDDIANIYSRSELSELLCSELGKDLRHKTQDSRLVVLDSLLENVCNDKELADMGTRVKAAIEYDNIPSLDKNVIERLFGREITASSTRLSGFAACPYKHFAEHILELKEREESKFEPLDIGKFYHSVLDGLFKKMQSQGKSFTSVSDDELLKILEEVKSEIVQSDSFIAGFVRHSEHNKFIIRSAQECLERFVPAIARMVRAGEFMPNCSEISFGYASKGLGEYKIPLSDKQTLSLRGMIDRLDIAQADGQRLAVVFDYKLSGKTFRWSEFYNGLDMQLAIYMLAAGCTDGGKSKIDKVIGAFYLPIVIGVDKADTSEIDEIAEKFGYKAKGIFNGEYFQLLDRTLTSGSSTFYNFSISINGDRYSRYNTSGSMKPEDFESVMQYAERKIISLAKEMVSGKIDVRPYRLNNDTPCGYCNYRAVCRFDWQINDYNFLESCRDKNEFIEKTGGGND